jgi:hypothetical protein
MEGPSAYTYCRGSERTLCGTTTRMEFSFSIFSNTCTPATIVRHLTKWIPNDDEEQKLYSGGDRHIFLMDQSLPDLQGNSRDHRTLFEEEHFPLKVIPDENPH